MQLLLEAGADATLPTRDSFLQITPLGSAVATTPGVPQPSDDEDVVLALVRLLLEAGADPNTRRKDGMTPLHAAAWRGLDHVVQELVDAGFAFVRACGRAVDTGDADVAAPYG